MMMMITLMTTLMTTLMMILVVLLTTIVAITKILAQGLQPAPRGGRGGDSGGLVLNNNINIIIIIIIIIIINVNVNDDMIINSMIIPYRL